MAPIAQPAGTLSTTHGNVRERVGSLLADNDEAKMFGGKMVQRGQTAARNCARRWAAAGRDCEVLIPDELGDDFNDLAQRTRAARHD